MPPRVLPQDTPPVRDALRFLGSKHHVFILGPVGVGKTFMVNALGHIACRRGTTVMAWRTDRLLKHLKASRLDNSYERPAVRLRRSLWARGR